MSERIVLFTLVAVAAFGALAVSASVRLRTRRQSMPTSGYSGIEKVLAAAVFGVGVFGALTLVEFGRSSGVLRIVLIATAVTVTAVGALLVWSRFATALAWDADGLTYFGAFRTDRVAWSRVRRARWDNRTRALLIESDGAVLRLPADLDGVRTMAKEMPTHLRDLDQAN